MKKFLFTLATLIAAGFAANAECPQFVFDQEAIEVVPGGDAVTVKIVLTADANEVIKGAQFQWVMRDDAGEIIPSDVIVERQNLGTPRVPNYQWFRNGVIMDDMGVPVSSSNPFDGKYRLLLANTATNIIMMGDELAYYNGEGIEPVLCTFQVKAAEGWEAAYATLTLEANPIEMVQANQDEYPNKIVGTTAVYLLEDGAMELKINNADYVAPQPKDLTGEIVFGDLDENGTFTVSYNGPEEVTLTITVNGEEVELVDGAYTLPAYGTYEVNVTATAEGYIPESRMKIFTWEEPVVEQTAAPTVNFEMRGEQLWCVITGEGTIFVDGQDYGPAPVEFLVTTQTTEVQEGSFFVYAIADGKTQSETVRANWTCEAKEVPVEYAETPVITYDEETLTVTATSADEVHLFINGIPVEGNSYTFEQTGEEVTYQVTAYASAENKENSPYASMEVVVPAKELEYTAVPVVTVEVTDDAYIFTATGDGEVTLYVDGVEVENPYTVARPETEPEEPYAVYVYATAKEEGKEMSQSDVQRIVIEPKPAPQPQPTPEPDVTIDVNDDAIVINVDGGDAEIHVYVDGVEITEPYTIERGDTDKDVVITVTAQGEDMEMTTVTIPYTIPAKEVEPVDPGDHTVGKWVVFIDKDGNEQWYKLTEHEATDPADQDAAETSVALTYEIYGAFDYYGGAERPNVDFFFVVDGVRYGATENETVPVWGQANDNPLVEGENYWCAPVGYKYTVGIVTNVETGEMFMQISQGIFVGVDEMNADKAIAGVRYFNMAGQEMQQANGMTIVVTTYTDGTTTAVKVMK